MVAGASGIDLALLVIAADEGIMPQTVEHLAVLEHLGVPAGIPVLSKADLVEPEWLELVAAEVGERLARSPVTFEAPLAVSARTGQGLAELRDRLTARAAELPPRSGFDLFRLPVDRAFSLAGVGTVVTGTAWSGRVRVGDAVTLLPSGEVARVRSIESYGHPLESSEPGARTAIGLAGVARELVRRGTWLVADADAWVPSRVVDVEIALDRTAARGLRSRSRVRVHLGTGEVMARVQPRAPIEPGAAGLARLTLDAPIVARGQDRFVLRSYSPVTTIGGGRVVDPVPPRRSPWSSDLASADPDRRLGALLGRRPAGVPDSRWPVLLGLPPREAEAVVQASPDVVRVEGLWARRTVIAELGDRALAALKSHHRAHPADRGMPLETLRRSLRASEPLAERALADLAEAGRLRSHDGVVVLSGFVPRVEGGDAEVDRIVQLLEAAALSPPSLAELARQTGRSDVAAILRLAAAAGRVEAVERDRYYARPALDRFTAALADIGGAGPIAPADLRDRLGISRKFMIPLLEWADAKGITERVGDARRLRRA
jgi:selenocysteine-specific elongation factor